MRIPAVNLKPQLAQTEPRWRALLDGLFARSQFILGPEGEAFEQEFAAFAGARHAVGCGNGTDAITLALRDAGVGAGDEVLTTALSAPFTAVGIAAAGARVRFADVDPETLQMDPAGAAGLITKRTKALVVVHLYGQPAPVDVFTRLGPVVVQDAAQAHGARYLGRPLTAWSPYVTYSFYPTKNLGALGDGGAITVNHGRIAARLRLMRDGGRRGMVAFTSGVNSRLDEMQCCYLRAFLEKLAEWNAARARIAGFYDEALRDCPGVRLVRRTAESVHHLYVLRARRRAALRAALAAKGIGTGLHYPVPLHLNPAFAACGQKRGSLPAAERAAREVLSLPLWPHLPLTQAEEVAAAVRAFYTR
ncbi:MAG: DegT/DnrJ/EryC1/StrS family aminotransferase [Bryobacteraceae bacterium]|nr:DegT/DnrJ/EryC1/StrS family aminotransferase [Bryobacteraceae bacterium]